MFNLFKKKTYTKDIINPLDNINIDNYKDLNKKEKELVNNLINEYKLLFKNNTSIIDIDKDLNKEFIIYQELILNIISKLDNNNILESIISLLKLKVYLDELNTIYDKLKYKYIALKKLKNNKEYIRKETLKYYLGKRKININNSLPNIINNISISLLNTYSLINIVNKEIINLRSIAINTNLNDYYNEIYNKLNKANKDYNLSFNNYLNIDNNLTKLVLEQIELEKFTYLNKDKKEELLNRLNKISNTEIKTKEEQQEIINNLLQIKTYFNIFNTYGRNIIKEEELNDLYQIIFNAYTYFTYDCEDFIEYYNNTYGYEKNYYDKIINFKIEMLKQGKTPALESINNQDKEEIKELLLEYIYKNTNNISLILSLEEENGLEYYFKNTKSDFLKRALLKNKMDLYSSSLKLVCSLAENKDTNLYDIYKLFMGLSYPGENEQFVYGNCNFYFYKIFKILFKEYLTVLNFNIIPEGIMNFNIEDFRKYLLKCDTEKPIILPDSVKDIEIDTDNLYTFILPNKINKLKIKSEKNKDTKRISKIVLPLEFEEIVYTPIKDADVNIILRKEILEFDDAKLEEYIYKIFFRTTVNNIHKHSKEHVNYFFPIIKNVINIPNISLMESNTIHTIKIDYTSLMSNKLKRSYCNSYLHLIECSNEIVACIVNSIKDYKKGSIKKS